ELWAPAQRRAIRIDAQQHDVVGHEPVTAHHQLERALTLADPALAEQEHPDARDLHEASVDARRRERRCAHLLSRLLLLERAEQLVGGLDLAQARPERLGAEQPREARQEQQVRAALLARRDEEEEEVGLLTVQ